MYGKNIALEKREAEKLLEDLGIKWLIAQGREAKVEIHKQMREVEVYLEESCQPVGI